MAEVKLTLTELAKTKLMEYLSEEPGTTYVRILVEDDGKFGLSLDEEEEGDLTFRHAGLMFVVEQKDRDAIQGLRIDYLEQGASSGFSLTGGSALSRAAKVVKAVESTPNPNAKKFRLSFKLGATKTFTPEAPEEAPIALRELLTFENVASLFQCDDFVTVTKAEDAEWEPILEQAHEVLNALQAPASQHRYTGPEGDDLPSRLARFVATDVAPFLQADGGDIELVKVQDDGTVQVRLVGACGTCPSSIATLKGGVERRLKAEFPNEVQTLELVA